MQHVHPATPEATAHPRAAHSQPGHHRGPVPGSGRPVVTIRVSAGVGSGPTRLAAFDAALRAAGVGDFNLVRLSSVVPPRSVVQQVPAREQVTGATGDLLYCVYADAYACTPSRSAWAGLAWSRHRDPAGGGLFVEHTGSSRADVERDLGLSLEALSQGRGGQHTEAGRRLVSADCVDVPVCALVVASYRSLGWDVEDDHGR